MTKPSAENQVFEKLVTEAVEGSCNALEEVVRLIQNRVYGLALRMLSHPEDAMDAAQEILIKVVTNLKGFRFEGSFQAWVYRIAANHLNSVRKSRMERFEISWEKAEQLVDQAEAKGWLTDPPAAPDRVLEIETRLRCTQALLTAMDRPHRLAFILGVVMDVSGREGAYILEISPAAFRKRVSRARGRLMGFLQTQCGLFEASNRCNCRGILANHLHNQWTVPENPMFMPKNAKAENNRALADCLKELDELSRVRVLLQAFPECSAPRNLSKKIKELLDKDHYLVLSDRTLH